MLRIVALGLLLVVTVIGCAKPLPPAPPAPPVETTVATPVTLEQNELQATVPEPPIQKPTAELGTPKSAAPPETGGPDGSPPAAGNTRPAKSQPQTSPDEAQSKSTGRAMFNAFRKAVTGVVPGADNLESPQK